MDLLKFARLFKKYGYKIFFNDNKCGIPLICKRNKCFIFSQKCVSANAHYVFSSGEKLNDIELLEYPDKKETLKEQRKEFNKFVNKILNWT